MRLQEQADDILLTITCLPEDAQAVRDDITLTSINVGYRGFGVKQPAGNEGSGSCNIDVVCSDLPGMLPEYIQRIP